jgi:thiol-disulfide isomerase/thioredoxin
MKFRTPLALSLACMFAGATPLLAQDNKDEKPAAKDKDTSSLKVGDPAPKIEVEKWVKGKPVEKFDPKQIYVVEFWATWCPPCKRSIPHLTELQEKYQDKVKIIGVSIWEESHPPADGKLLENVQKFVEEWGDRMDYTVAFGGKEARMSKTWMTAAGQGGIPAAFIVKENKIQWIGSPFGMDKPLEGIVSGTYDASKSAEDQKAFEKKSRELGRKFATAQRNGDDKEALAALEELVAHDPSVELDLAPMKLTLLYKAEGPDQAYAFARKLGDGKARNNAEMLNALAWTIIDTKELETKDWDLALSLATRADELSKHKNAAILDTLAHAQFGKGDTEAAIQTETKALAALTPSEEDQFKEDMEKALAKFKAAKK